MQKYVLDAIVMMLIDFNDTYIKLMRQESVNYCI